MLGLLTWELNATKIGAFPWSNPVIVTMLSCTLSDMILRKFKARSPRSSARTVVLSSARRSGLLGNPKQPRMAPNWSQMAPKQPQNAPSRPQDCPQWRQDGAKMAQDGPRWPRGGPRSPQDGLNIGPRWHRMARVGPKAGQDRPKIALGCVPDSPR